jgi:hypothetical protein
MSGSGAKVQELKRREEQSRLSKEELLRPRIVERDEYIESLGGNIRIRSLSHAARQEIRARAKFNTNEWDEDLFTNLTIVYSLVDPALTDDDITKLREQDASVYDEIVLKLTMLNMLGRTEDLKKD